MSFNYDYPQVVRDAGFKLRQYKDGPLDWRLMGSYEIERILREQNLEQIDNALLHLSEAPLSVMLETNILDSGIAKYFLLSQFAIQYLLFCRKFLDETVGELRETYGSSQLELVQVRKSLTEANNEILQLHKKITQIEAIREVVYPCHLCPKNFVSNEALNIHIGRKHSQRTLLNERRRSETPPIATGVEGIPKEKDNDLNLINTIKMELEIKQLKERLNVAEKNIRERSSGNSLRPTPREMPKDTRNVGIQSNLTEVKEKDDVSEISESEASERKEQLNALYERINGFESWQKALKVSNDQFITEINKKLEFITHSLEQSKHKNDLIEERVSSPCVDDLERLLMEKVSEIGKASAEKLEEVVYHMEMGYKDKLEALEKELNMLSVSRGKERNQCEPAPRLRHDIEMNQLKGTAPELKNNDNTYEIKTSKSNEQVQLKEIKNNMVVLNSLEDVNSIGSNQTFVKSTNDSDIEAPIPQARKPRLVQPLAESTDISESLNDDSQSITNTESESLNIVAQKPEANNFFNEGAPTKDIKLKRMKKVCVPKPLTRKDIKKLVNKNLTVHGFDVKSKSVTNSTLNRVNADLTEKRNKLKLQYPHFFATRSKIKKFVDKLCSTKLPEAAESLMKNKQALQPVDAPHKHNLKSASSSAGEHILNDTDESSSSIPPPATPLDKEDVKDRLENLLTLPAWQINHTVQVHSDSTKPMPLPRKRVMFNTVSNSKTIDEDNADELKGNNY